MLFIVLWSAGMMGVFSLFWVKLPIPKEELTLPLAIVKLVNLITPTFLLSVAVLVGVYLAHKIGFSAPLAEAIASNTSHKILALKSQIRPGLVGGVIGGIALSFLSLVWRSSLPSDFLDKGEELLKNTPFLTRILYGGITEEILIRWGLMTFLVWAAWHVLQKAQGEPHPTYIVIAIVISSFVFGLGHLPLAFALTTQATTSLFLYIVIGNSLFGLIAGYLYWQQGLEAAIIAHILAHVVMAIIKSLLSL